VKKYIAVGEKIVFCVVFCRSVIVLFLLAIVLPALALGDLKTLLALFLKQKACTQIYMVRPYTENYHFPHSDIFFHRKQKSDFYFLDIKKNQ